MDILNTMIGPLRLVLLLCLLPASLTFPSYQEVLPNGNNVNHPCKVNYRWPGLGHNNPLGGGERNAFGQDFARLGRTWNLALCRMDSDGDGRSNGEELGDPQCVWQPGQTVERSENISHPGVCEPLDSPRCQGQVDFVDCQLETFQDCKAISYDHVRSESLRFPTIQIPNTETNYFCMTFDLPTDDDYHLVAYEPLIDNANVMHHILLYGCPTTNGPVLPTPEICGMSQSDNNCNEIIGLWGVGVPGMCFPENLGFRIGSNGYKRIRMEAHYNNPTLRTDWTDSSGLKIYYQPAEPQFVDLKTLQIGQVLLEIPPGEARVPQVGICPGDCTSVVMTKPAKIYSAINHMHYLGRAMKIELFRNGKLFRNVTNEDYYSYDNPIEHINTPAIDLLPGDELRTTCVFNSLSTDRWTYYGEGTNDEMCFGFLTIYPKDALPEGATCVSLGPLSACDSYFGTPKLGCDWRTFINGSHPDTAPWWNQVTKNCNNNGFCRPECLATVREVMRHPCMATEMKDTVNFYLSTFSEGNQLLSRLYSCGAEPGTSAGGDVCSWDDCRDVCGDDVRDSSVAMATSMASVVVAVLTASLLSY